MNPDWRGKPVIVRPAPSEHTGAIAASYESKAWGVHTGMRVSEARKLCPDLIVAEARPGDHILVMSNGSFGGIHGKLLDALTVVE